LSDKGKYRNGSYGEPLQCVQYFGCRWSSFQRSYRDFLISFVQIPGDKWGLEPPRCPSRGCSANCVAKLWCLE